MAPEPRYNSEQMSWLKTHTNESDKKKLFC